MKKPENFLQAVWDKLTDKEKKEIYLDDLVTTEGAPAYLAGAIENAPASLDDKIAIAEKIIKGEKLTDAERKKIDLQIAD
jgi:hypothetical protein